MIPIKNKYKYSCTLQINPPPKHLYLVCAKISSTLYWKLETEWNEKCHKINFMFISKNFL